MVDPVDFRQHSTFLSSAVNPVAVWEIKEYYHITILGSRVADGVYETLLDGMEFEDIRVATGVEVEHVLIDYTWWECATEDIYVA